MSTAVAQPKDFGFTTDERMLRDSAARFLKENAGIEKLRATVAKDHHEAYEAQTPPAAWDPSLWKKMVELGWTALAVPADHDGMGMSMTAVAALAEEVGRAALPSPLISTLMATYVVSAGAPDTAAKWLRRIIEGAPATLAVTAASGSWEPSNTDVRVQHDGKVIVLSGSASFVQDARKAELFVVSARGRAGVGLYVVAADTPGIRIQADRIVDLTRDQATVSFDEVELTPHAEIAAPGKGERALGAALPALLTIVAADLCGAAEWQLQTTAEYARIRTQFDRPIGFFQAVKHPIVNMMIEVDRARSLVYNAACAIDHEPVKAERCARMAKAAASDAAAYCSGRSVQLHGGIGFTWECDVHIYFKRQKHNQFLFGDGIHHRAKLAASM